MATKKKAKPAAKSALVKKAAKKVAKKHVKSGNARKTTSALPSQSLILNSLSANDEITLANVRLAGLHLHGLRPTIFGKPEFCPISYIESLLPKDHDYMNADPDSLKEDFERIRSHSAEDLSESDSNAIKELYFASRYGIPYLHQLILRSKSADPLLALFDKRSNESIKDFDFLQILAFALHMDAYQILGHHASNSDFRYAVKPPKINNPISMIFYLDHWLFNNWPSRRFFLKVNEVFDLIQDKGNAPYTDASINDTSAVLINISDQFYSVFHKSNIYDTRLLAFYSALCRALDYSPRDMLELLEFRIGFGRSMVINKLVSLGFGDEA